MQYFYYIYSGQNEVKKTTFLMLKFLANAIANKTQTKWNDNLKKISIQNHFFACGFLSKLIN